MKLKRADTLEVCSCRFCRRRVLAPGLPAHQRSRACQRVRALKHKDLTAKQRAARLVRRKARLTAKGYVECMVPSALDGVLDVVRFKDSMPIGAGFLSPPWLPQWQAALVPLFGIFKPPHRRALRSLCDSRREARDVLATLVALDTNGSYDGALEWLRAHSLVLEAAPWP